LPVDPIALRRAEREALLALARGYVERLGERLPVAAAAVAGSVARGDFNVWSDVDVVVVTPALPGRLLERTLLLLAEAPARIEAVGFTPEELAAAWERGNRLVREAAAVGVVLLGEPVFRALGRGEGARAVG
jgi:predicted nucleotidyltransferase